MSNTFQLFHLSVSERGVNKLEPPFYGKRLVKCRYHTFVFKVWHILVVWWKWSLFSTLWPLRKKERERRTGTSSHFHLRSAVELWGSLLCFCTSVNGTVAQSQLLRWEFPFENVGKTSLKKGQTNVRWIGGLHVCLVGGGVASEARQKNVLWYFPAERNDEGNVGLCHIQRPVFRCHAAQDVFKPKQVKRPKKKWHLPFALQ